LALSVGNGAGVDVDEDDDLMAAIAAQPLDLTVDEVAAYLAALGDEAATEGASWLRVGMALYHQFGGSEDGWELFDDGAPGEWEGECERLAAEGVATGAPTGETAGAVPTVGGSVAVRADHLAALCGAARSYADDLETGLADGTYEDAADLEAVTAALAAVEGEA
jgi:hypothetical protein